MSWINFRTDPNKNVGPNALQMAGKTDASFSPFGRVILTLDEAFVYSALPPLAVSLLRKKKQTKEKFE